LRGKKAKKLRKQVYGDFSHRVKEYDKNKLPQVVCIGRRAIYQKLKKQK